MDKIKVAIYCRISPFADEFTLTHLCGIQKAALMEKAAWESLSPFLEKSQCSVGTRLDISHISATPVGMKVRAESIVTTTEGRKIVFDVKAFDECGLIGSGTHERFIIDAESFMEKCRSKSTF